MFNSFLTPILIASSFSFKHARIKWLRNCKVWYFAIYYFVSSRSMCWVHRPNSMDPTSTGSDRLGDEVARPIKAKLLSLGFYGLWCELLLFLGERKRSSIITRFQRVIMRRSAIIIIVNLRSWPQLSPREGGEIDNLLIRVSSNHGRLVRSEPNTYI